MNAPDDLTSAADGGVVAVLIVVAACCYDAVVGGDVGAVDYGFGLHKDAVCRNTEMTNRKYCNCFPYCHKACSGSPVVCVVAVVAAGSAPV